jgi:hypothetical protein
MITVITPTIGKPTLMDLISSISSQPYPIRHIFLWDNKRDDFYKDDKDVYSIADFETENYSIENIIIHDSIVQGKAYGSALRAIGLMVANTKWVTFADDDVRWTENHLKSFGLDNPDNSEYQWMFCQRHIYAKENKGKVEYIGVDNFESMGEQAKTPYKMVDNNCMVFSRKLGSLAACLYRETTEYNDDRLMYDFLKSYGGEPFITNQATITQVCPDNLVEFFKRNIL